MFGASEDPSRTQSPFKKDRLRPILESSRGAEWSALPILKIRGRGPCTKS